MLISGKAVTFPLHKVLFFSFFFSDTVDNDVHVDISGLIVAVRMGANEGLMSRKILCGKFSANSLSLLHGQSVIRHVSWIKAHNIVVRFNFFPCAVLSKAPIGLHALDTEKGRLGELSLHDIVFTEKHFPFRSQDRLAGPLIEPEHQVVQDLPVISIPARNVFYCCHNAPCTSSPAFC